MLSAASSGCSMNGVRSVCGTCHMEFSSVEQTLLHAKQQHSILDFPGCEICKKPQWLMVRFNYECRSCMNYTSHVCKTGQKQTGLKQEKGLEVNKKRGEVLGTEENCEGNVKMEKELETLQVIPVSEKQTVSESNVVENCVSQKGLMIKKKIEEMRKRTNEASKAYRAKKKKEIEGMQDELQHVKDRNKQLQDEVSSIEIQVANAKTQLYEMYKVMKQ